MQQYADIYSLQNYSTCFGCHSTHHQRYQNLYPASGTGHTVKCKDELLVPLLPSYVVWSGPAFHPCILQYDLYRRLRVQFLILLMMGAVTPETCTVVLQ